MVSAYLVGTASVSFWILVPIAYLLILSAGLLIVSRHYRNIFLAVCALFVACALLFEWEGIRSGYLQILGIGMLGISVGYIPIERINGILKRRLAILFTYSAYLLAITLWNDPYPLQIVGVCLSLAIIYWMGMGDPDGNIRVLHQIHLDPRQILSRQPHRLRGPIGIDGQPDGRTGQRRERVPVCEQLRSQIGHRNGGQQVPAPVDSQPGRGRAWSADRGPEWGPAPPRCGWLSSH